MSAVAPADSTVAFIRQKIRHLTASPGESSLTTALIDQYINNFYNNDFPYAIKLDQMRSVYTFFTVPYVDRYPMDVNFNMGIRSPVYFEGIAGSLFKDRANFYSLWPRFPTQLQQGTQTITGEITGIAQPTNPTEITSPNHGLSTGSVIEIVDVGGMTQLNDNFFTVTVIDSNTFSLDEDDNTTYGAYTGGGTWTSNEQTFSFQLPGPFLSKEVVIGGEDTTGNPIRINDDGDGNLLYLVPNESGSVPAQNSNPAFPGMYNRNTGNPGLINPTIIGTVDYISGQIDFVLPSGVSLAEGTNLNIWISQYQPGRPYNLLFWNNELTVRPVPDKVYKVEVESYLTPIQFMSSTDLPILNQWAQYIAYGAALEILRDRQDMEGVENLMEGFKRQEALVLERQGVEEIGTPNYTVFNSAQVNWLNGGWGQGGFFG